MNLEQLLDKAQPLDVIFYHGTGIFSTTIRILETLVTDDSRFSHVGIVVTSELLPNVLQLEQGKKYIFESNLVIPNVTDGTPDVRTGKVRFGVQIRSLEEVAKAFTTTEKGNYIALSGLAGSPWSDDKLKTVLTDKVSKFVEEYGYKGYELNPFSLFSAIFPCCGRVNQVVEHKIVDGLKTIPFMNDTLDIDVTTVADSTVFCSELAVRLYQRLGIIPNTVDAQSVSPMALLNPGTKFKKFLNEPVKVIIS